MATLEEPAHVFLPPQMGHAQHEIPTLCHVQRQYGKLLHKSATRKAVDSLTGNMRRPSLMCFLRLGDEKHLKSSVHTRAADPRHHAVGSQRNGCRCGPSVLLNLHLMCRAALQRQHAQSTRGENDDGVLGPQQTAVNLIRGADRHAQCANRASIMPLSRCPAKRHTLFYDSTRKPGARARHCLTELQDDGIVAVPVTHATCRSCAGRARLWRRPARATVSEDLRNGERAGTAWLSRRRCHFWGVTR